MGTVAAILCQYSLGGPPDLPVAVMFQFDKYSAWTHMGKRSVCSHCLLQLLAPGDQDRRIVLPIASSEISMSSLKVSH